MPELEELEEGPSPQGMPPKIPYPKDGTETEIAEWKRLNFARAQEIRKLRLAGEIPPAEPAPLKKKPGRPRKGPAGGASGSPTTSGTRAGGSARLHVASPPPPPPAEEPPDVLYIRPDPERLAKVLEGLGACANICLARGTDIWLMNEDEAVLMADSLATMAERSAITRKAIDSMPAIYLCLGLGAYLVRNVPDTVDHYRARRGKPRKAPTPAQEAYAPPPQQAPGAPQAPVEGFTQALPGQQDEEEVDRLGHAYIS